MAKPGELLKRLYCIFLCLLIAAVMTGCTPAAPDGGGNGNTTNGNDNSGTDDPGNGDDPGDDPTGGGGDSDWVESAKVTADDPAFEDLFGDAIALEGDHLLVGTRYKDDLQGAVYAFRLTNGEWIRGQKLVGERSVEAPEGFGKSIALQEDTAIIGAESYAPPGSFVFQFGGLFVFQRKGETWSLDQLLISEDGESGGNLGSSVALDGDTLVAGAPGTANLRGSAHVFERTAATWRESATLIASDGINFEQFGAALAIDGDTLAIGAPVQNFGTGAVYVFERQNGVWVETAKLLAPQPTETDQFGLEVVLEGDTLVAAAPLRDNDFGFDGGEVYIYERLGSAWQLQQTLRPDDGEFGWRLGGHMDIDGDQLAVASEVYSFIILLERSGDQWVETARLMPEESAPGDDSFGGSVSLDTKSGRVAGGARSADLPEAGAAGAAYVFENSGDGP